MEALDIEPVLNRPKGIFRRIADTAIRSAIKSLLLWFPNEVISNGINNFFTYIIDDERAFEDRMNLDAFVNRMADLIKRQTIGRISSSQERPQIRDYLKRSLLLLPSGALNCLYLEKQSIIQSTIDDNISGNEERKKKFIFWLTEASKAISALGNKQVEKALRSGDNAEFLIQLQARTQNVAVAMFLMDIFANNNRQAILPEINLVVLQVLREIEKTNYC